MENTTKNTTAAATATIDTIESLTEALSTAVDSYNAAETLAEKLAAGLEEDKLVKRWNTLSELNAWTECLGAERPMEAFLRKFTFKTISVKVEKGSNLHSLPTEEKYSDRRLTLPEFVNFAATKKVDVCASKDWRKAVEAARTTAAHQVELFLEGGADAMSSTALKKAMQAAYDAVLFVPNDKGGNRLVASTKNMRVLLVTITDTSKNGLSAIVARTNKWYERFVADLHLALQGKTFSIAYGDDELEHTSLYKPATKGGKKTSPAAAATK